MIFILCNVMIFFGKANVVMSGCGSTDIGNGCHIANCCGNIHCYGACNPDVVRTDY